MLNYFTETGDDFVADGGTCSFYTDRAGNPITVNSCNGDGPRGAADDANLARQQAKIVAAINALGADVVSLEEIENSAQFAGPTVATPRWPPWSTRSTRPPAPARLGVRPVPGAGRRPAVADEDVIRTAFIYKRGRGRAGRRPRPILTRTRPSPTPASRWPRRSSPPAARPTRTSW